MTLIDSLTHAGVWVDDRQIIRFTVEWGEQFKKGKAEIIVMPFKGEEESLQLESKAEVLSDLTQNSLGR